MLSYVPIYFYKENVKLLLYLYVSVCISMGTHQYGPLQTHAFDFNVYKGFLLRPMRWSCENLFTIMAIELCFLSN